MTTDAGAPAADLHPWRTMWFAPRATIRRVVDAEARPSWRPVIALAALDQVFTGLQIDATGAVAVADSFMPVTLGLLQLAFGIAVGPFLLAFVGGWLGGEADPSEIRQAVAWSHVPIAAAAVVWIPLLLIGGFDILKAGSDPTAPMSAVGWVLVLVMVTGALWALVLQVAALAEVQQFSIGRSIASLVIPLVPFLLIGALG
jgi:hypothetical protein